MKKIDMHFDSLVKELEEKSNVSKQDILKLVNNKYSEMQALITKEGAVYLIARDLNVVLSGESNMQIKDIVPDMRNINIIGRIFKVSKITEFKKAGGSGRVANIFIGDKSGFIRVPLWNDQVKVVEEGLVNLGDVIQVNNGMSKENVFGDTEISLGKFGSIKHMEEFVDLPSIEELSKFFTSFTPERSAIINIASGGNFEIKGTIVQLFKGNYLFNVCSICGSKLEDNKCNEHGEVSPDQALVLSFVVDDGTGDIRCVLFRDVVERFSGVAAKELSELEPEQRYEMMKERILGKEAVFAGRIKRNNMFDRMELIVNDFKDINALEESKKLTDVIEFMIGG